MFSKRKIQNTIYQILNTNSGVTLLELVIAVTLFALTILAASDIFQSVINSQRQAIAAQNLQENIRYGFEKISKEIRTAQKDKNNTCIPAGNNIYWTDIAGAQLRFLNYRGQCVKYYLDNGRLYVSYPFSSEPALAAGLPLTAQKLTVSNLNFQVTDSSAGQQAIVTVKMRAETTVKGSAMEKVDMQTTLSSRFYE